MARKFIGATCLILTIPCLAASVVLFIISHVVWTDAHAMYSATYPTACVVTAMGISHEGKTGPPVVGPISSTGTTVGRTDYYEYRYKMRVAVERPPEMVAKCAHPESYLPDKKETPSTHCLNKHPNALQDDACGMGLTFTAVQDKRDYYSSCKRFDCRVAKDMSYVVLEPQEEGTNYMYYSLLAFGAIFLLFPVGCYCLNWKMLEVDHPLFTWDPETEGYKKIPDEKLETTWDDSKQAYTQRYVNRQGGDDKTYTQDYNKADELKGTPKPLPQI
jgi:hypothetical protein